ncbi:PREDICTED: putative F-box protein At3g20705 [Camelina sativa]|uniref:F-box protein At3g20705 n=1 Tax=Camelina sativa TaxID=90675 RepID=A0ABM0T3J0_CAMSA|nr:PREDICTED: putative F-box protein At3g20705 [Camelina sativa]
MMMSNLPRDLLEEILSRVPLTSLKAMRSTCKNWNALTKEQSFANKRGKMFLMIMNHRVYLIGVNLHGSHNNTDLDLNNNRKLVCRDKTAQESFYVSQVFHCNGLLLCVSAKPNDDTRLVVCNPYLGYSERITPRFSYGRSDKFALGYDKSCGSYKILRLFGLDNKLEIYNLSSKSWMVPNATLEWDIDYMQPGVSSKGNTYWCAREKGSKDHYLFCFDFTNERVGPRLPLPVNGAYVSLSAFKEDQLAVLLQLPDKSEMEIWVTNKIEPDAVSWRNFLRVGMKPCVRSCNFLIDKENKFAVVFDNDKEKGFKTIYNIAYVIGEDDYYTRVDLRESPNTTLCRLVCSYVPSCVQIK